MKNSISKKNTFSDDDNVSSEQNSNNEALIIENPSSEEENLNHAYSLNTPSPFPIQNSIIDVSLQHINRIIIIQNIQHAVMFTYEFYQAVHYSIEASSPNSVEITFEEENTNVNSDENHIKDYLSFLQQNHQRLITSNTLMAGFVAINPSLQQGIATGAGFLLRTVGGERAVPIADFIDSASDAAQHITDELAIRYIINHRADDMERYATYHSVHPTINYGAAVFYRNAATAVDYLRIGLIAAFTYGIDIPLTGIRIPAMRNAWSMTGVNTSLNTGALTAMSAILTLVNFIAYYLCIAADHINPVLRYFAPDRYPEYVPPPEPQQSLDVIEETINKAGNIVTSATNKVRYQTKKAANNAKEALNHVGKELEETANKASDNIKSAVDDIEEAFEHANDKMKETADAAKETMEQAALKIQSTARGMFARNKVKAIKEEKIKSDKPSEKTIDSEHKEEINNIPVEEETKDNHSMKEIALIQAEGSITEIRQNMAHALEDASGTISSAANKVAMSIDQATQTISKAITKYSIRKKEKTIIKNDSSTNTKPTDTIEKDQDTNISPNQETILVNQDHHLEEQKDNHVAVTTSPVVTAINDLDNSHEPTNVIHQQPVVAPRHSSGLHLNLFGRHQEHQQHDDSHHNNHHTFHLPHVHLPNPFSSNHVQSPSRETGSLNNIRDTHQLEPSNAPTSQPSQQPTWAPTSQPSEQLAWVPTSQPLQQPIWAPIQPPRENNTNNNDTDNNFIGLAGTFFFIQYQQDNPINDYLGVLSSVSGNHAI